MQWILLELLDSRYIGETDLFYQVFIFYHSNVRSIQCVSICSCVQMKRAKENKNFVFFRLQIFLLYQRILIDQYSKSSFSLQLNSRT